jgi:FkbM family methyltransferase
MIFILRIIKKALTFFRPPDMHSRYLNYIVTHHKNDSLINRIKNSPVRIYEKEETDILVRILKKMNNPVMLDIGANIGLISLNICAAFNPVKLYAFEPGPNQFRYLKHNIEQNGLTERVSIFNVALGSGEGVTDFFMHAVQDSSGDGMRDTGRAGKGKFIQVPSQTLDTWWRGHATPPVNLIKLDTEGAELLVLRNATALLQKCKPYLLVEICYLNYEKYGLTFEEHLDFFHGQQYHLLDIRTGERVLKNSTVWSDLFYYLAVPEEHYEFL